MQAQTLEQRIEKAQFKGSPLIELPKNIPTIGYLEGEFGKDILQEYYRIAEEEFGRPYFLDVLYFKDNVVKGSNPYAVCLMDSILEEIGLHVATQADLEKTIKLNNSNPALGLNLIDQYEDTVLVLRSTDEPNKYLAEKLAKQIESRQKIKYPIMINLTDLKIENDSKSPHGLSFKLKDKAEIIHAPQLGQNNYNKTFSETNENGLPVFDEKGNRVLLCTINSGLYGLCVNGSLGLGSLRSSLDGSCSGGRVVVVDECAAVPAEKYISEIDEEIKKKTDELQRIRDEAIARIRNQ